MIETGRGARVIEGWREKERGAWTERVREDRRAYGRERERGAWTERVREDRRAYGREREGHGQSPLFHRGKESVWKKKKSKSIHI